MMLRTARLLIFALAATFCSTLSSVTARVLAGDGYSLDSHEHTFHCGNEHVGPDRQAEIEAPIQQALALRQSQRVAATSQPTAEDEAGLITVPVYWHVIYQAQDVADGYYPDSTIAAQIGVLNSVYNAVGFEFVLAGVDRTLNADWFQNLQSQTQEEADMTTALHKGDAATLNFYTARMASLGGTSTLLGYSYNPWDVVDFPTYDGVYVNDRTMPGGSAVSSSYTFNLGIVSVHEVGHWLGLYHTFNGNNCTGSGDMVSDTHPEASACFTCTARASCPMYPGTDPIRNYMDYTDDVCRTGFSAGQVQRITDIWSLYRAPDAVPPAGTPTFSTGGPVPAPASGPTPTPTPAPAPTAGATGDGRIIPKTATQPAPGKPTARPVSSSSSSQAAKPKLTPKPVPKPHVQPHAKPHAKPHPKPHVKPHPKPHHPTPHAKPHARPTAKPAAKKKPPVHTLKSKAGLKRVIQLRHSVTTSAKAMMDAILPMI